MDEIGKHIVRFIINDEVKGFEVVYKHYYNMILNYIRKYAFAITFGGIILTKDDAEEILIEVFWEAWKSRKVFKILACFTEKEYKDLLANFPNAEKILEPFIRKENNKVYVNLINIKDSEKGDLGKAFDEIMKHVDLKKLEDGFEDWLFLMARWKVKDHLERLNLPQKPAPPPQPITPVLDRDQVERVINFLSPLKNDIVNDILFFKKDILFLVYEIEISYKWLAKVLYDKELDENELQRKVTNLRQIVQRAREDLRLRGQGCLQLGKKELKRERERLRDVCRKIRDKLEKLRDNLPGTGNSQDKILLDGYIEDLKLWMEALVSW